MISALEKALAFAAVIFVGVVVTRPLTWRMKLLKIQVAIAHDVGNTRSWGNPSIFKYRHRQGSR